MHTIPGKTYAVTFIRVPGMITHVSVALFAKKPGRLMVHTHFGMEWAVRRAGLPHWALNKSEVGPNWDQCEKAHYDKNCWLAILFNPHYI